ncbi:MAG: hypothetical protein E7095_08055 [Bacteroides sp.]|nr:hypothetical protein [Bacteroides sp.]
MRKILFVLFIALISLTTYAQSEYISSSRVVDADRFENLENDGGLLLLSVHNDLVINVTNANKKVKIENRGKNVEGMYEYYIIVDSEDTRTPKVEVSRRGSVYKTEFVQAVKPDFLIAYRLEEVMNPIRLDNQTRPNDARLNAEEAELEFTTTIKNLQVLVNPELGAKIETKISPSDNNITITTVIIQVSVIRDAEKNMNVAQKDFESHEKWLEDAKDKATDADWDKLDELEKRSEESAAFYRNLMSVEIFGEGTNQLSIDISDLGPRSKKCYAVLPLTIEKEIFRTECSVRVNEGGKLFGMRKYKEAKEAYMSALKAEGATAEIKPTIQTSVSLCDSCMMYENLAAKSIKKIGELRKVGLATQEEVARYASAAIEFMQVLNMYNPCDFYQERIEKLDNMIAGMPLKVLFTIVEWKTLREGLSISDVEIWAYNGKEQITSSVFSSSRKFKKIVEKQGLDYRQVGISDSQGKVEVELDRKNLPKGFVFRPKERKDVKVNYIDMKDLMRQAVGTFMEKRFRLKMYTK